MRPRRRPLRSRLRAAAVALTLALAASLVPGCGEGRDGAIDLSGTISFRAVRVGSLVGGRVARVSVQEGERVKAGDLVVAFDASEWQTALAEAEAQHRAADQRLKLLLAGTRKEAIDAARAQAEQLKLQFELKRRGPREEEVKEAEEHVKAAEAALHEAEATLARTRSLLGSGNASAQDVDRDQRRHDEALGTARALEQRLKLLRGGYQAEEVEAARQAWLQAKARLEELEAGPRKEEVDAARAEVEAAAARVEKARVKLGELEVRSPADALVHALELRTGDLVPAGSPVAVLLLAEAPWVQVYAPEDRLAKVRLGAAASIRVDGLDRDLRGRVVYVSREAEFTPRNVQTKGERVSQVFAVKVEIDDAPPELKDGMWADVVVR